LTKIWLLQIDVSVTIENIQLVESEKNRWYSIFRIDKVNNLIQVKYQKLISPSIFFICNS